jgi:hypothetical protein
MKSLLAVGVATNANGMVTLNQRETASTRGLSEFISIRMFALDTSFSLTVRQD